MKMPTSFILVRRSGAWWLVNPPTKSALSDHNRIEDAVVFGDVGVDAMKELERRCAILHAGVTRK